MIAIHASSLSSPPRSISPSTIETGANSPPASLVKLATRPAGLSIHGLNRANGRLKVFKSDDDFLAFEQVLKLAHEQAPIRILGWCMMNNHWHLVLWP